ncbi:hypothetical protein CDIK_0219 [Cucumispora dikerogammari]|nr:hypothetical protein CDIK_0219 [Cucumispora dikerogammari]
MDKIDEQEPFVTRKMIIVVICVFILTALFLANSLPPQMDYNGLPEPSSFTNHIVKTFYMISSAFMNVLAPAEMSMGGMPHPNQQGPPGMGNMLSYNSPSSMSQHGGPPYMEPSVDQLRGVPHNRLKHMNPALEKVNPSNRRKVRR